GMVVAVNLASGSEVVGLGFAIFVSIFAGMIHVAFSPYRESSWHRLQLTILVNQICVSMILAFFKTEEESQSIKDSFEMLLIALQAVVFAYGIWCMVPVYKPACMVLMGKSKAAYRTYVSDGQAFWKRRGTQDLAVSIFECANPVYDLFKYPLPRHDKKNEHDVSDTKPSSVPEEPQEQFPERLSESSFHSSSDALGWLDTSESVFDRALETRL
ncbi:hypothetical protein CYMTET_52023, partial [Cymbomonas tetramitiformis]